MKYRTETRPGETESESATQWHRENMKYTKRTHLPSPLYKKRFQRTHLSGPGYGLVLQLSGARFQCAGWRRKRATCAQFVALSQLTQTTENGGWPCPPDDHE